MLHPSVVCKTQNTSINYETYYNLFAFEISWIVIVTCTVEKLKGGAPKGVMNPLLHKAQNRNQYCCP